MAGVKGEELDWMGTPEWLASQGNGMVSKSDLATHMQEQSPALQEVVYGQPANPATIEQLRTARDAAEANGTNDEAVAANIAYQRAQSSSPGKFASLSLPGAEPGSYREWMVSLPEHSAEEGTNYSVPAAHAYGDKASDVNRLVHVRVNEREVTPEGGKPLKALFLEEVQSDWHQQGRRQGYQQPSLSQSELDKKLDGLAHEQQTATPERSSQIDDEIDQLIREQKANLAGVPNAPFKSSWPELALKRMIREAAEQGKDALAWTNGETQAARYDLSKQIKRLQYTDTGYLEAWDHQGNRVMNEAAVKPEQLQDYVGKDVAEKLMKQEPGPVSKVRELNGVDLRVGGEGMLKFYDDMLVNVANKLGKKYGARAEMGQTNAGNEMRYEGPTLTDNQLYEQHRSLLNSNVPVSYAHQIAAVRIAMDIGGKTFAEAMNKEGSTGLAEMLGGKMLSAGKTLSVHVLRLTPELRERALSQGFPLFSAGVPLNVVAPSGRVHTLHPVAHDPFSDEGIQRGEST